jgi:hypothetical protein
MFGRGGFEGFGNERTDHGTLIEADKKGEGENII